MNFIRSIKEDLKDPKKKSISLLLIYLVFFIIVFILINIGESNNTNNIKYEPKEVITNNKLDNYEYLVRISDNEDINEIIGIYPTDIDNVEYEYSTIELLIDNSDSMTTYKDSNKILYNISIDKYFRLLNKDNDCKNIDCSIIGVKIIIEKDEYINNVLIDLSEYYGYNYTIEITYKI